MGEEASRYDAVAVALHWLIGVALLAQITFGFLLDEIAPRGTPSRSAVINLHKSFGLVLAVAILARLAWRLGHRAPPWPATMPEWQQRAATWWHCALYACMLLMPASGYVASNFRSSSAWRCAPGDLMCHGCTTSSTACTSQPPGCSAC
jgi:cytochrome b561